MSYIHTRYGRRARPMGGWMSVVQTVANVTGIAADMTYLRSRDDRRETSPAPAPTTRSMGDLASTITNIASGLGVAADLATDPYLPETVCRVGQLGAIKKGQKPGPCVKTAKGLKGGVGLSKLVVPLRAYVYAEQHRWAYAAAVAGVIGLPLLLGYTIGKGSK